MSISMSLSACLNKQRPHRAIFGDNKSSPPSHSQQQSSSVIGHRQFRTGAVVVLPKPLPLLLLLLLRQLSQHFPTSRLAHNFLMMIDSANTAAIKSGNDLSSTNHHGSAVVDGAIENPFSIVLYVLCHYDFSQLEYVAPFLERFPGSRVFIYPSNGRRVKIREHYLSKEYARYNVTVHDLSLESIVYTLVNENPLRKVVFLSTASMAYPFGQYQRITVDAIKDVLPERVWGLTAVGHCMYGCSSCKGNDHKIPVYFTRYFRKELPYTAQSLLKQYLPAGKGTPVLVPLSTGSTSMVGQRDMLELLLDLQKKDKFRFVFKLHPTCFNIDDYDMSDPIDRAERDNVEFLHKNFVVTSEEQPCLLPFYEAFEVILCDLHSSVGFMAQYFSPRVIFAYHNDADYDVPDRDPEFMANMVVFDDLAGMKRLLVDEPLPKACGSPSFFYKTYGHVDGTEIERYAKLCDWPRMKDCVPAPPPIDYRTTLRAAATKWKEVLFEAVTRAKFQPDDGHERHYNACKLAMGIRREAEIRVDDRANGSLSKFTGDVETLSGRPRVKVLSLNVWHGMEAHPAKHSVSQTAKLILETRADIVGIQEATGLPKDPSKPRERTSNLSKLAAALTEQSGEPWYSYDQGVIVPSEFSYIPWGIVSRLKITAESRGRWGVEVELAAGGQRVWLFNAHLMYFPYQPYQLANIPYDGQPMLVTERDAIDGCKNARGRQVELLMADIKQSVPTGTPYFLTGDFNEPSHLDWTMDALVSGAHPVPCQWPTTHTLTTELGVTDVFRACHADEVSVPAYTWTPRKDWDAFLKPYRVDGEHKNLEHHDRIDFVFAKANGASAFKLIDAVTIGPEMMKKSAANAIVQRTHFKTVEEFPTDHCAVLAEFAL